MLCLVFVFGCAIAAYPGRTAIRACCWVGAFFFGILWLLAMSWMANSHPIKENPVPLLAISGFLTLLCIVGLLGTSKT